MRNFKIEDFEGCGQYLIRANRDHYTDTGFMTTIMKKVGWMIGTRAAGRTGQRMCLIDMSDGLVVDGYFITKDELGNKIEMHNWVWVSFEEKEDDRFAGKRAFVEYLNNPQYSQEYRFATNEELVRIANYQKSRTE